MDLLKCDNNTYINIAYVKVMEKMDGMIHVTVINTNQSSAIYKNNKDDLYKCRTLKLEKFTTNLQY